MSLSYWRDKHVFVTGATGFLGSCLTKELIDSGVRITVLEQDFEPKSNFYRFGLDKKARIVRGDITNFFLLERIFNEHEIELCFHLAAQPLVPIANRSPLSSFESNIRGTWCLLEAARRNPLKPKLVIASSDKAYGDSADLPYKETHSLSGSYPYDVSKTCADLLAQSYFRTYGTPLAIVRCGNFYGGGDLHWSRIVPGSIRAVLLDQNPIVRSDGLLKRDYFYIKDVVRAYMAVGEKMDDQKIWGEAFNFGTEIPVTVLDIVDKIIKIGGKLHLQTEIRNENHGEISEQYLSTEKARTWLNWKPAYSLDQGLRETYLWYEQFLPNI